MKNMIFLLLGLLTSINNATAATIVDQDFLVDWNTFTQFNETPLAQTFTVGTTGQLTQIDLVLSQLDPVGNLVIEVQNTINGVPVVDNPTVLGSLLMPLNQLPSSSPGGTGPGLVTIDLTSVNIDVTTGEELAVVLRKDRGGLTPQYGAAWFGRSDPDLTYSNGSVWMLGEEGSGCGHTIFFSSTATSTENCWPAWVESITSDYIFRTYVSAGPLPPAVTFLASGWEASNFLTLSLPTRSIEFDSNDNLYIEDKSDDNSETIKILKLDAASGYSNPPSEFVIYATSYQGATGLDFDGLGSLYVSERSLSGDAGVIREIDVNTQTLLGDVMTFAKYHPTGVGADESGNVFYTGRKESDGTFGNIYQIDSMGVRSVLIDNIVGTGIAIDAAGNIFISTPNKAGLALLSNSIYMFNSSDLHNPVLIATFDSTVGELTFDDSGNLYVIDNINNVNIIKLAVTPISSNTPGTSGGSGGGMLNTYSLFVFLSLLISAHANNTLNSYEKNRLNNNQV